MLSFIYCLLKFLFLCVLTICLKVRYLFLSLREKELL